MKKIILILTSVLMSIMGAPPLVAQAFSPSEVGWPNNFSEITGKLATAPTSRVITPRLNTVATVEKGVIKTSLRCDYTASAPKSIGGTFRAAAGVPEITYHGTWTNMPGVMHAGVIPPIDFISGGKPYHINEQRAEYVKVNGTWTSNKYVIGLNEFFAPLPAAWSKISIDSLKRLLGATEILQVNSVTVRWRTSVDRVLSDVKKYQKSLGVNTAEDLYRLCGTQQTLYAPAANQLVIWFPVMEKISATEIRCTPYGAFGGVNGEVPVPLSSVNLAAMRNHNNMTNLVNAQLQVILMNDCAWDTTGLSPEAKDILYLSGYGSGGQCAQWMWPLGSAPQKLALRPIVGSTPSIGADGTITYDPNKPAALRSVLRESNNAKAYAQDYFLNLTTGSRGASFEYLLGEHR